VPGKEYSVSTKGEQSMKNLHRVLGCVAVLISTGTSRAALVYKEGWSGTDLEGWTTKASYLTLSHSSSEGDPAGSLQGAFAEQGIPMSEVDSFRATAAASGGSFVGNYWEDFSGAFWGWRFSFYAANYMPSELSFRFSDGANVLFYNALPQLGGTGAWYAISVPALSASNWFGGAPAVWSNALGNVQFVEVQVSRNTSTDAQVFYLDNFETVAIPEPATFALSVTAVGWLRMILRRRRFVTVKSVPATGV
jgi:hypothetical protein